ncbi:MAG: cysteine--tRNA ligase [Chloroflexi bacterium]|nr:cysteine--tRNA ligase [Chloroflexota bacterium]
MKLYNTLSGQKEEFRPQGEPVRIYVCGVTPYDECHVGHAMSYIFFDVLRRYLEFRGYKLRYVQNFTDIDDKIINRANQRGVTARELADKYIARYFEDMDALNIRRADVYPYATREIPEILRLIGGLVEKGHAYASGGDVYFRVRSFVSYGRLSNRTLEGMLAGARVEPGEGKEFPLDFALWKGAKPGEPSWPSPWGQGRPGWHIECSAMSLKYLGETLDIHGGGQDLIFPHHENEIAQSEAFTGKPFVRHFIHNALLQLGREKMSKSLGNLVPVREALARWGADALRLFVLSSHYRSPLAFSEEALEGAQRAAERLRIAYRRRGGGEETPCDWAAFRAKFVEAMDDDFNTPQGAAVLFDLARAIHQEADAGWSVQAGQAMLVELAAVLGLSLEEERPELDGVMLEKVYSGTAEELARVGHTQIWARVKTQTEAPEARVDSLIKAREELRKAKEWSLADRIRKRLAEMGIALEDTTQGTLWRYRK